MKIYTKKGDQGQTGLFGGSRVPKDHLRIQAYGTLDELNSALGWALAERSLPDEIRKRLVRVQGELFQMGAELATPADKKVSTALVTELHTGALEREIDQMESALSPLTSFILPGGSESAARLHMARTISRRAERECVTLGGTEPLRPELLTYLNRMSDYLFVSARYANHLLKVADVPWHAPA